MRDPDDEQWRAALEAVTRTTTHAIALIRHTVDAQVAYDRATALRAALVTATSEVATLRAQAVRRLRVTLGLSLSALADKISLSKPRADQLDRAGQTAEATETREPT